MKTNTVKSVLFPAVVLAAAVAQAHVEPGSFLNKPARTVDQLVYETEHDPQVLDRFERHFQMSKHDVIIMFEHLHLGKIRRTGSFVVYNCHEDEVIRARVFRLKAGTPVFVDDNGMPILKFSCGNPMIGPRPPKVVVVIPPPPPPPPPHILPPPPPVVVPPPQVIVTPPPPVVIPPPPPAPPITNNYTTGGNVTNNKTIESSSLFFLPIVLVFTNNHHHTTVVQKQKPPVPEPASMLVMGVGAATLLIRKRKSRRA